MSKNISSFYFPFYLLYLDYSVNVIIKSKNFIDMNNQITRRNLLKLLGISGVTLPLTGISKDIDINPQKSLQNDGTIKLSSNENPYGPSPKVREAIINAFDEACRYPYGRVAELEKKIAEREGVDPSMVLVTGGSNEGPCTHDLRRRI